MTNPDKNAEKVPTIQIVHETLFESIAKDVTTFGVLALMMWFGYLMGSSAFQWIMGTVWFIALVSRASSAYKKARMTIPEAREFLDKLEAGDASE
jgi:hypothetical protein